MEDLRFGVPDVEPQSLALKEKLHTFVFLSSCDLKWLGCGVFPDESMSLPLAPPLMLSFPPLFGGSVC